MAKTMIERIREVEQRETKKQSGAPENKAAQTDDTQAADAERTEAQGEEATTSRRGRKAASK